MEKWSKRFIRLVTACGMFALAGCGSGGGADAPVVDYGKVRTMTEFYTAYLGSHRNQPPANEQAFRDFLNTKQENLQKAGLTVEDMFTSPRSGKPLQWVYGRTPPANRGMTYLAYETEPVGGKRLVLATRGMYEELDEAQFREVFPNKQ